MAPFEAQFYVIYSQKMVIFGHKMNEDVIDSKIFKGQQIDQLTIDCILIIFGSVQECVFYIGTSSLQRKSSKIYAYARLLQSLGIV